MQIETNAGHPSANDDIVASFEIPSPVKTTCSNSNNNKVEHLAEDGDNARSTIEESPISVDSSPFLIGGRKTLVPSKPYVHENLTDDLDDLERDLDNQNKSDKTLEENKVKQSVKSSKEKTPDKQEMKTTKNVGFKISDDNADIEEGSDQDADITSEAEVIKTVSESSEAVSRQEISETATRTIPGTDSSTTAIRTIPRTDSSATGIKTIPKTDSSSEEEVEEKKKSKKMKTAAQRKRTRVNSR